MNAQTPDPSRSRALFITSGVFNDSAFTDLDAVGRTAEALKDQLRVPAVWGISNADCRVIKAHEWTREEILRAVANESEAAEDCFVLYFAGHGVADGGQLLLPLQYSTAGMPSTMLEFGDLMREVGKGRAQTKIVLIDCCHAGLAMGDLPLEQHVAGEDPEGSYVIAACEANRTAKSPEDHEFTAFGGALISCLAKGGPPEQQYWTPEQLLERIDAVLTADGHPLPVSNRSQVGTRPWVKNRHWRKHFKAADHAGPGADQDTPLPAQTGAVRYLGPDPLPLPIPFLGRDTLLDKARRRVHMGKVLPVTGGEQVGKSALLTALVADADSFDQLPLPPVVLEIEPSSAAESPLLEAVARALHQTLDDSELSATVAPRTDSLLGLVLPRQVKGRSLILVVKASHIDLTRPELRAELAELREWDVFKRAAVIVETTDSDQIDGGLWRPFDVPALTTPDAHVLIRDWLTGENLVTDVESLQLVDYDDIVRRPGIIERAVRLVSRQHRTGSFDNFLAGLDTGSGAAQEIAAEEFDQALMEAAEPTIAGALERALSIVGSDERIKGQALLTVWGVMDELPVPVDVLQRLGLPKDVLGVLFQEGVLVPARRPAATTSAATTTPAARTPCLEISPVSRAALRADLQRRVRAAAGTAAPGTPGTGGDPGDPIDLDGLDQRLTAAARLLGSAVLPDGQTEGASEDAVQVIETLRRATGWLDRHVPEGLTGLRYLLGLYVNSQYTDAFLLPVAQSIDAAAPGGRAGAGDGGAQAGADAGSESGTAPGGPADAVGAVDAADAADVTDAADGDEAAGDEAGGGAGPAQPPARIDELYAAAGRLNLASRGSAQDADAGAVFVEAFEYAVSLLQACGDAPPWHMLRAVDQCGFHGGRRLRVVSGIVPARVRLTRHLAAVLLENRRSENRGPENRGPENRTVPRVDRLLWSVSWCLNTAAAQIAAATTPDDRADAEATLQLSERFLEALPPAPDSRARQARNWLSYRLAGLRRATAVAPEERLDAARTAYELARENALLTADLPERVQQWTQNLLASGFAYVQETREDQARLNLAEETLSTLEEIWGPREEWAMPLLAEAAGFLRRVHARHADSELQYAGAREVLALLRDRDLESGPGGGPATAMAADHMTELAQAHAFLAYVLRERNEQSGARQSLRNGIQLARKAAKKFPSAHTYKAWLRLLRTMEDWFGGGRGRTLLPEHAKAVEEIRGWLADAREARHGNQTMALLHLWCLDSDWRREGSLPIAAKGLAARGSWNIGRSPEQVRADQVHRARWAALHAHERGFGPTWALYEARFRILREYQRWSAIYGRRPQDVDHKPVWALLDTAERLFQQDLDVKRARAFYHRYIWEYGEAARLHFETARRERDGDRSRRGLVDAAECLLSLALHQEGTTAQERESALRTAAEYLQEVAGLHSQTHRAALLSARIALELDLPVDWDLADAKFNELIGDNYVGNVGRYLNERRLRADTEPRGNADTQGGDEADTDAEDAKAARPQEPFAVDDLLEEHFTDVDVLRSLGSLYLRRSILSADHDPEAARAAAWRAYNCFDGRRVMEIALNNQEKVDTAFLRGQTITWAAELTSSASPFPGESGRKRGWLHLAESLLQSARSRSAGSFHRLICTWDERLRALRSTLNDQ
ncbi:caspase family protein [Streptomyces sp. M41]|uniref:caspase, EACC1-associated type n=1 Tax=Streptomyces sp. M41 TaxID=3059412 RepID=UPI00374D6009